MPDPAKPWDSELVRRWLEKRLQAVRLDQATADRRGYAAQDDYDKAAAEEWVCQTLQTDPSTNHQTAFAQHLKLLLGREDYRITGIHDDRRCDRYVRATLRKIARMAKANEGFANTLRYHQ